MGLRKATATSTKSSEVVVTRPDIPHSSNILSKKSCLVAHQETSKKPATIRNDDNLKMLANLASKEDDEETVCYSDDEAKDDDEGPEDFYNDDEEFVCEAQVKTNLSRESSLKHVKPLVQCEKSPYKGIQF